MTNRRLDVNATASLAGSALPIAGATTAVGVAIVDGSGNQITSFGGGTQYTDGGVPPAHPTAPTLLWNDGANWQTVSTSKPLPITIAGGLSNPLPVSLTSTTITGTVAATQSGNWSTRQLDGSGTAITSTAMSTSRGLDTAIVDGSGNNIGKLGIVGETSTFMDTIFGPLIYGREAGTGASAIAHSLRTNSSGHLLVGQATASNLNATVVGTGTFAVQNTPVASASIFNGKTTVATAGVRGTLAASQAVQSVTVKALSTNTGFVYVGNTSVSSANGFQLQAGESLSMDVANLNTVNLDVSVSGEGVSYVGIG
jgi:hypothetical protein